jgi:hypothetical protein
MAFAQDRASINGTITDSSGARVIDAHIVVTATSTGLVRESQTDAKGTYQVAALPVGRFTISITRDKFAPVVITNVDLLVSQARTVNAVLPVMTTSQQVSVSAPSDLLNRNSAEQTLVIEAPQIADIPLNGRNWASLMTLAPSAVNSGGCLIQECSTRIFAMSRALRLISAGERNYISRQVS